jgi:hypothetical protein
MAGLSIKDAILYVEKSRNNYKISKIKKIIREFNLSDDEVNQILDVNKVIERGLYEKFPKYSKENVNNGTFFSNEYTIENDGILDSIFTSLY